MMKTAATLVVAGLIIVSGLAMMGCSPQEKTQSEPQRTRVETQAPQEVTQAKDAVCGMSVSSDSPHKTVYEGKVYYFCSVDCKDAFMKNPSEYVAQ
jgi:YHS domain-containing protein